MTAGEVAREVARRGVGQVERAVRREQARRGRPHAAAPAADVAAALADHFEIASLAPGLRDPRDTARLVRERFPDAASGIVEEAERALRGELRPFGGDVVALGSKVDWLADYGSGRRWPIVHHTGLALSHPDSSDVRRLWEVNRLQHLCALGRAFALTGDERFAEGIVACLRSWRDANPVEHGPNWSNAMEVGIRAVNVVVAARLTHGARAWDRDELTLLATTLVEHERFIADNLELNHRLTSNHYLADLVGLLFVALGAPALPGAAGRARGAFDRIVGELLKQIHPDGTDYEASTHYHRLVLELALHSLLLSREAGLEAPAEVWVRLERMFDVAMHSLDPAGEMPIVGDSDDGRLVMWHERPAVDQSYLAPIAASLFGANAFKRSDRTSPEALWLLGRDGLATFDALATTASEPPSKGYPDGGLYAMRGGGLFVLADCGGNGIFGRGSHNHNDTLSFELFGAGRRLVVDPGTFAYTGDPVARDLFRSTLWHNTARIDGEEISPSPGGLFVMGPDPRPRVLRWEPGESSDVLEAEHSGYARLPGAVVHRRTFVLDKREGTLVVEDEIRGEGTHVVELSLVFAPDCVPRDGDPLVLTDAATGQPLLAVAIASAVAFERTIVDRSVSRAYGHRTPSRGAVFAATATLPVRARLALVPARSGEQADALAARASALAAGRTGPEPR